MAERIANVTALVLVKDDEYWLPYCFAAAKGWFNKFVIYDVGSEDSTRDIIEYFIDSQRKDTDFVYRPLPHAEPLIQGTFRNSMIAEAGTDYYLLLDADEVWLQSSLIVLQEEMPRMIEAYETEGKLYGIVRRLEVARKLDALQGMDERVPHHRLYHRTATWTGTHPGEDATIVQKPRNEYNFNNKVKLLHFHQPDRSTLDDQVPSRISRRFKPTYTRGKSTPVDLMKTVPLLRKPIGNFLILLICLLYPAKMI